MFRSVVLSLLFSAPAGALAQQPVPAAPTIIGAATMADVTHGTTIYDPSGVVLGQVESASNGLVTISTEVSRAQVPLSAFAKVATGVELGATAAQMDVTMQASTLAAPNDAAAAAPPN